MRRLGHIVGLSTISVVLGACSVIGDQSDDTLAPLDSATATIAPADSSSVPPPSTVDTTTAPTTSAPAPIAITGPFPTSIPAGECTPAAIGADFGTAPASWLECAGAWAVTRIEECPPDTECEGVDIFRWTKDGWQHRGMTYSLCVLMVDETGLPRSINDKILSGNTDCIEPIGYVDESTSGPLAVGAKGTRTRRVQTRLIEWQLLADRADGYFGANTRNAVFDFQHLAGLSPTGTVDEITMRALGLVWP